jgi:hypothetical protein
MEITAGTNTKITYDAKGLVTAGSAATTADIAASTDKNYVTDAELVVVGNTSNTNTGDQTAAQVVSTATGAIEATNVDSAIAELEAEKLALAGGTMTGNITMNGTETVDGRDLSVDGAKLDLIEPSATADQTAAQVVSTATGAIEATNVDSAIAELEAEKLALAGGTMSGDITMGANDISGTGSVTATTFSGNLIGNILDSNENVLVKGTATTNAVNEISIANAATTSGPTISATGNDTNIDLNIEAKGTGIVNTSGDLTVGGAIDVTDAATTRNNLGIYTGTATLLSNGFDPATLSILNGNVIETSVIIITLNSDPGTSVSFYVSDIASGSFKITTTGGINDTSVKYLIIN